jgi:hypothetical protein
MLNPNKAGDNYHTQTLIGKIKNSTWNSSFPFLAAATETALFLKQHQRQKLDRANRPPSFYPGSSRHRRIIRGGFKKEQWIGW